MKRLCCWFGWAFGILLVLLIAVGGYFVARFSIDRAVVYADPENRFKYGSTGGERASGFPYWIWRVLPSICSDKLEGIGYASLGMIYEPGHDLPIGVSKRRVTGMDRVFLNCAVCHTSTVRDSPASKPRIILGMPANTFDLMAFKNFFFECAVDARFSPEFIIPAIDAARQKEGEGRLSLPDRRIIYPAAIYIMRDRLLMLKDRFVFSDRQPAWGPGRVDTFNSAKAIFNYRWDLADPREMIGTTDFPSIWNQGPRRNMQLHWDGNNTVMEERNRSAAFGTGTTPPTIDHASLALIEADLLEFSPPDYPYPIDKVLAARGAPLYAKYCADCHGANGRDFTGKHVGKVTPLAEVGTDSWRLDSYTYELAVNQSALYAGYEPYRFKHFRKTYGYANAPLDGVWLRAPYLHNGSVPTLRDLLEPSSNRPTLFYRGYDVYDPVKVGFITQVATENGRRYFMFDTTVSGNGNHGHEGARYGTELGDGDKWALVEYLKTF